MDKAHGQRLGLECGEGGRLVKMGDRKMLGRRLEVLADRDNVAPGSTQGVQDKPDFVRRLPPSR